MPFRFLSYALPCYFFREVVECGSPLCRFGEYIVASANQNHSSWKAATFENLHRNQ